MAILKAMWDALRGIKLIWRKRNKIQAKRTVSSLALMKVMSKGFPKRCGTQKDTASRAGGQRSGSASR
jgi:hypothetical protein